MTKQKEKNIVPDETVMDKIYYIREQKVMLDHDLAELYGVGTKRLKEAVRRNKIRFPKDFMFQMNKKETGTIRKPRILIGFNRKEEKQNSPES